MWGKKVVPLAIATPSLFPHCIAILVCWALPALYTLYGRDRGSAVFAVIEAVTCAIGNGLLTALPLYMASQDHSSDATDAAVQALIWLLFMAMYFPLEGTPPWASCQHPARTYPLGRRTYGRRTYPLSPILFTYLPLEGHMNAALTAGAWACGQVSLAMGAVCHRGLEP